MTHLTVLVTDSSGRPREGEEVKVWKEGFFGGSHPSSRTDKNGEAHFSLDYVGPLDDISVGVKGQVLHRGKPRARIHVSI